MTLYTVCTMANYEDRYLEGEPGTFFVDQDCIACDTCTGLAKAHFKLTEDFDHAIVVKQPQTEDELATCEHALEACPVFAIGKQS